MKPNGSIVVHNLFPIVCELSNDHTHVSFNNKITISVIQRKAIAATDASVKGYSIGGCWTLADVNRSFKSERMMNHKNWEDDASGNVEVIVLLELITAIERIGRHVDEGEIRIGFDYKIGCAKIVKSMLKCDKYAQESGSKIAMIKKLLKRIKFDVKI